jgi:IS30 family transposase
VGHSHAPVAIYRSLFIQARGVLKKELMDHLRSKRCMRRSRHASEHGQSRGQIVDAISIRERPAEVEARAIPGQWEGDLLSGAKHSYIATLVERHSRFVMLIRVPSRDTAEVVRALSKHVRKLPATLRRSLTWDRGLEMAKHKDFTVATDVKVYFCDPQSPWQRGSNENTNGLLRQYFPRGTDLAVWSQVATSCRICTCDRYDGSRMHSTGRQCTPETCIAVSALLSKLHMQREMRYWQRERRSKWRSAGGLRKFHRGLHRS